jgi:hypothetical protein
LNVIFVRMDVLEFGFHRRRNLMTTVDELIAQKEAVAKDSSLSPEERKVQLRKIRKALRKASGHVAQPRDPNQPTKSATKRAREGGRSHYAPAVDFQTLLVKTKEYFESQKEMTEYSPKDRPGYSFPLALCASQGIDDPEVFVRKFQERWKVQPTEYAFLNFTKDTMLFLGPLPAVRDYR